MTTEIARPIRGWKPTTPDLGRETLEALCNECPAIAIHFWAPWNGGDPLMDHGIQQIANQFANRIRFFSVNVDTERGVELAQRFGVANVPTMVVLRPDIKPRLVVGYGGAEDLANKLESLLLVPKSRRWWAFWRGDI